MKKIVGTLIVLVFAAAFVLNAVAAMESRYDEYLIALEEQVCEKVMDLNKSDLSVEQRLALKDMLKKAKWKPITKFDDDVEITDDMKIERKARIEAKVSSMNEKQKLKRIEQLYNLVGDLNKIVTD